MLTTFRADLHIHTCLSPCGDLQMVPSAIVARAVQQGLDVVAVCDHNSAENVGAVKTAAAETGLYVVGGMEITTSEEVHVLGLFESDDDLQQMQRVVYEHLAGMNDVRFFGEQLVSDADDRFVESNDRFLMGATCLGVSQVVTAIHDFGGLAVGSHVDREAFSLIGQLGFVPPNLPLDALELSARHDRSKMGVYRSYGFPLITSSDAHYLDDIGRSYTELVMERATFGELRMAFAGIEGRESRV